MEIHKICSDCNYSEICSADNRQGVRAKQCVDYWVDDFNGDIFYSQPKFTLGINTDGEINNYHFGTIQTLERFLIEELRKGKSTSNVCVCRYEGCTYVPVRNCPIHGMLATEYNGEGNA